MSLNRALLIKLFYQFGGNLSTALGENRRLNCLHKGPMSRQALKKIIQKFEETGDLFVMRGREGDGFQMKLQKIWLLPLSKESLAPNILRQVLERYHVISLYPGLQCKRL